jgi:ParB family chromosome partitioning protein
MTMSKTAIDAKRGTHFLVEPESLMLVTDTDDALYDPRVENAVSEEMVASILSHGVIEPVIIRKNGMRLEVIDGRQRVKNAIEANKRLKKDGAPTLAIPAILRREDDADAFEISVMLNEIREQDGILVKAEKAKRLLDMGRTEKDIAQAFGVTGVAVRTWLRVLDLSAAVKAAVKRGDISASEAVKELADLPREEQVKKLETLIASATMTARNRRSRDEDSESDDDDGEEEIIGNRKRKISPVSRLRGLYRSESAMSQLTERERVLLGWIFGRETDGDLLTKIPQLSDSLNEVKGRKPKAPKEPKAAKAKRKAAASGSAQAEATA